MVCIESSCQCPKGYLETWLNTYSDSEKDQVPPAGRKFCIKPDKLTFMAYFPQFECIDSFAVRFATEPLEVTDATPASLIKTVEPMVPKRRIGRPIELVINTKDPKGISIRITYLYPTYGDNLYGCVDYNQDGTIVVGTLGQISFRGYFTHPDTISGHLLFEGASGTKDTLEDYQLENIKLIRIVPY